MSNNKLKYFKVEDVYTTLNTSYQQALEYGDLIEPINDEEEVPIEKVNFKWWNNILEWDNIFEAKPTKSKNPVTYINCRYTNHNGEKGLLLIEFQDEKIANNIEPIDEAELAEINSKIDTSKGVPLMKLREPDAKIKLRVKKYRVNPKIEVDSSNNKINITEVPDAEHNSLLFRVVELINKAFKSEFQNYFDIGWMAKQGTKAAKGKKGFTPVIVKNDTIIPLIYEYYSHEDKKFGGQLIPNPAARLKLKHNQFTGDFYNPDKDRGVKPLQRNTAILDTKTRGFATYNGQYININNVHKFITYNSKIRGILNMGSVCFSGAGISCGCTLMAINVEQPEIQELDDSDIYGNINGGSIETIGSPSLLETKPVVASAKQDINDDIPLDSDSDDDEHENLINNLIA